MGSRCPHGLAPVRSRPVFPLVPYFEQRSLFAVDEAGSPWLRVASFFAGIGGFDLGFERAGLESVWQCELKSFCTDILEQHWPAVPRATDIREVRCR